MTRRAVWTLLSLAAGILAAGACLALADPRAVAGALRTVGVRGAAAFVAVAGITLAAPAAGWWMLLRAEGARVRYLECLKACVTGFVLNFATPSMYLGGEPVRILYLSARAGLGRRLVTATLVVNKFHELAGLVAGIAACGAVMLVRFRFPSPGARAGFAALLALLAALTVLIFLALAGRFGPAVRTLGWLARRGIFPARLERWKASAEETERLVREMLTRKWRTTLAAQAVTTLSTAAIFLRPAILFAFLPDAPVRPGVADLAMLFATSQLIMALPSLPGGLGIFEGGMLVFFAAIDPARAGGLRTIGMTYGVLTRLGDALWIGIGLWLMARAGLRRLGGS